MQLSREYQLLLQDSIVCFHEREAGVMSRTNMNICHLFKIQREVTKAHSETRAKCIITLQLCI